MAALPWSGLYPVKPDLRQTVHKYKPTRYETEALISSIYKITKIVRAL